MHHLKLISTKCIRPKGLVTAEKALFGTNATNTTAVAKSQIEAGKYLAEERLKYVQDVKKGLNLDSVLGFSARKTKYRHHQTNEPRIMNIYNTSIQGSTDLSGFLMEENLLKEVFQLVPMMVNLADEELNDTFNNFLAYMNNNYLERENIESFSEEELKRLRNVFDKMKLMDSEKIDKELPKFAKELKSIKRGKFQSF